MLFSVVVKFSFVIIGHAMLFTPVNRLAGKMVSEMNCNFAAVCSLTFLCKCLYVCTFFTVLSLFFISYGLCLK